MTVRSNTRVFKVFIGIIHTLEAVTIKTLVVAPVTQLTVTINNPHNPVGIVAYAVGSVCDRNTTMIARN